MGARRRRRPLRDPCGDLRRLVRGRAARRQRRAASRGRSAIVLLFGLAVPARLPGRLLQHRDRAGRRPVRQGTGAVRDHFAFAAAGIAYLARRPVALLLGGARRALRRDRAQRASTGSPSSPSPKRAGNLDQTVLGAARSATRGRSTSTARSRAPTSTGRTRSPNDPNHLGIMLLVPLLILTPLYLRLERGHRLQAAARRCCCRSCSWSSWRRSRAAACSGSPSGR